MPADFSQVLSLAADLGKASTEVTKKAAVVVAKVANDIEADAKQLAPVDTGALRNSISATVRTLSAEIGPTVNYAPYQEFGTHRTPPQPFMGPAADRNEPAFTRAMEQLGGDLL